MSKRKLCDPDEIVDTIKTCFEDVLKTNAINKNLLDNIEIDVILHIIKTLKNEMLRPTLITTIHEIINTFDDEDFLLNVFKEEQIIINDTLEILKNRAKEVMNITNNLCNENNCFKVATHNDAGCTNALYCINHAKQDMKKLKKFCCAKTCYNTLTFNLKMHCYPLYCKKHYSIMNEEVNTDENVPKKKCALCDNIATHNFRYSNEPLMCGEHKHGKMVNKCICADSSCGKIALYNYPHRTKRLYCLTHKKNDMVKKYGLGR